MKIAFNCFTKSVLHKPNLTLFKGETPQEKSQPATGAEIKPQPKQDTVELTTKTAPAVQPVDTKASPAPAETAKNPTESAKTATKCEDGKCK